MSARKMVVRFAGASVVFALLSAAACSESPDVTFADSNDDGGSATFPDTGSVERDSGPRSDSGVIEETLPKCGNLKVETGETCDDGNTSNDDGCSSTCKIVSAFEGDACPGKTMTFAPGGAGLKASVTGTTAGAFNHYGSACGGGSGKDVVYTFTPPTSGKAIVTLTADYTAIVSARSSCNVSTSESGCSDLSAPAGGTTKLEVPVFQNTPAYLFVDGYGGSSGTFKLDVEITQAACGNGIGELPEACDDGNTVAGDGCSPTCTLEAGGLITQCPGQPFELTGAAGQPRRIGFSGDTMAQGQSTQNAAGCFYSTGSNIVYALKSDIAGSVKADLLAGYTKVGLHARTDCGSSDFQLGCTQRETPGTSTLSFPTKAGEWFYVIVDGYAQASLSYGGPFSLDVTVTPAECGNHLLDGNEQCDDGNDVPGDGCDASCKLEALPAVGTCPGHTLALAPQGDGSRTGSVSSSTTGLSSKHAQCALNGAGPDAVFAVTPDIDGFLTASTTSSFNTSLAIRKTCGDKFPDGGTVPTDAQLACSYNVIIPSTMSDPWIIEGVGNGPRSIGLPVVANTTYYVVVDGVSSNGSFNGSFELSVAVRPPVCGNGIIEGTETCDDGGTESNDGCDASCKLEPVTSRSTCGDAEAVALTQTSPGNYSASLARGTTNLLANSNISTSTSDADLPCWAPGKNAFFAVTAPEAGVLRATAKSSAFDVVLNFRKPTCALTTAPTTCANESGKGNEETVALPVAAGEMVWVVVDSKQATEWGRFALDVTLTPSGCGDGFFVAGPDEQCDDGNTIAGDGCTADCKLEAITNVDVCPGRPLTLASGGGQQAHRGTITFSTATLNGDYSGACGGGSRDGVVKVTAPISGFLRGKTRGMLGSTVYARTTCNDPSTEISKSKYSTCLGAVPEEVYFQVTAGTDYYLFVDGLDGATGVPTLDVTISP